MAASEGLPSAKPTVSFWHRHVPESLLHYRTGPLPESSDVVIIGSGLTGTFAAERLIQENEGRPSNDQLKVVMLEAREACWGATGRNGGHCQPLVYSSTPEVAKFELANLNMLREVVQRHGIDCEWRETGIGACHAYFTQDVFDAAKASMASMPNEYQDLVRVVENRDELAELRISKAIGAVCMKTAASLSPYKLIASVLQRLLSTSSNFHLQTSTAVTELSRQGGKWKVETNEGTVKTRYVLCAANGYTASIIPSLKDLIVPVRGQMSALSPSPESRLLKTRLPCTYAFLGAVGQDDSLDDYLIQRRCPSAEGDDGGELMFGGGRLLALNEGVNVDDDSTVDEPVASYLRSLPAYMDLGVSKELEAKAEWTGVMGYSRDGAPWVGEVPQHENLFVAAGYTGHGMPNGALCGVHVANLICLALSNKYWREEERRAVEEGRLPKPYVLNPGRITAARNIAPVRFLNDAARLRVQ